MSAAERQMALLEVRRLRTYSKRITIGQAIQLINNAIHKNGDLYDETV